MLPRRIPKPPKRSSRWRTSAEDGCFNEPIQPETLRELIAYNPETGNLFWKERDQRYFSSPRDWKIWNTRYSGKEASGIVRGYARIRVLGVALAGHRVAWAIHFEKWPSAQIDHINGSRGDNRICNLREATNEENSRNIKLPCNNTSGRIGVSQQKATGHWRAEICFNQKRIHLGSFKNFEDACAARKSAEQKFGFHHNHGRPHV